MPRRERSSWIRLVVELERSGLPHAEFATKHGVGLATLRSWLYRLRKERAVAQAPSLLPVRVIASTAPTARWQREDGAAIEAELPSGVRLRFSSGVDPDYVAELVRRLG